MLFEKLNLQKSKFIYFIYGCFQIISWIFLFIFFHLHRNIFSTVPNTIKFTNFIVKIPTTLFSRDFHNEKDKKLAILRTFDPTKIQLCVSLPAKTHLIFTRSGDCPQDHGYLATFCFGYSWHEMVVSHYVCHRRYETQSRALGYYFPESSGSSRRI